MAPWGSGGLSVPLRVEEEWCPDAEALVRGGCRLWDSTAPRRARTPRGRLDGRRGPAPATAKGDAGPTDDAADRSVGFLRAIRTNVVFYPRSMAPGRARKGAAGAAPVRYAFTSSRAVSACLPRQSIMTMPAAMRAPPAMIGVSRGPIQSLSQPCR